MPFYSTYCTLFLLKIKQKKSNFALRVMVGLMVLYDIDLKDSVDTLDGRNDPKCPQASCFILAKWVSYSYLFPIHMSFLVKDHTPNLFSYEVL